jgi:hypothetical protein
MSEPEEPLEPESALVSIVERRSEEFMTLLNGMLHGGPFQWDEPQFAFIGDNLRAQVRVAIQDYIHHTAAWLSRNGGVNGVAHANALQERAGNEELV